MHKYIEDNQILFMNYPKRYKISRIEYFENWDRNVQ